MYILKMFLFYRTDKLSLPRLKLHHIDDEIHGNYLAQLLFQRKQYLPSFNNLAFSSLKHC